MTNWMQNKFLEWGLKVMFRRFQIFANTLLKRIMEYKPRISYLRDQMSNSDLDTVFISSKENIRYFSGFTGTFAFLIISDKKALIVTDSRYTIRATEECPNFEIYQIKAGINWIENITKQIGTKILGFEGENLAVNMLEQMKSKAPNVSEWKDFSDPVTQGRVIKSEEEVDIIKRTINISDSAFNEVSKVITIGMTEKEIAWEIEKTMRELGAESPSFDTIVASGVNGAKPHHTPTDKKIEDNEGIVIDMGAKYEGYCSDLTRTIYIGEPSKKFREVYSTVHRAQLIAIETAQPDMTGEDLDALARTVISNAGFGENFGHSLGHGVGIAIHENPTVGPTSKNIIKPGMIYTIEPGIYLENWGGVRIEDMMLFTDSGNEILSHAIKEVF